jgi:hypothetical protein
VTGSTNRQHDGNRVQSPESHATEAYGALAV